MTVWLCAPPSDHASNWYCRPSSVCGDGALTEVLEPRMTVRLNGVRSALGPTASSSPVGDDWKASAAVRGSSWSVRAPVSPPESVTVRVRLMYDGYSWSTVRNVPLATPLKPWSGWVWHVPGQCS